MKLPITTCALTLRFFFLLAFFAAECLNHEDPLGLNNWLMSKFSSEGANG